MNFKNTLYWRLSLGLLALLLLLGVTYIVITANTARNYFQETTQKLNSHVAEQMLLEVQPFSDSGTVNDEALGKIMHSMMAVNPSLEVYLVSPEGEILSFVVLDKKVLDQVLRYNITLQVPYLVITNGSYCMALSLNDSTMKEMDVLPEL